MNAPLRLRVVIGLVVAGLLGSAAAHAAAPSDYWVYFGTYTGKKSKGIYVSRMDGNGHLTAPELADIAPSPAFLAVDPQHRFLYAANEVSQFRGQKTGAITAYAIDAVTGRLIRLNQVSSLGAGPAHLSVDGGGRTVMVANYGGGSEAAYPVNPDGSLGSASSFIQNHGSSINPHRQAEPHPHCIVPDPSDRFALLCDLGLDQVLVFRLDAAAGKLTPNNPPFAVVQPGSGPRHIAFRPDGRFAYVINEIACTLTVFSFNRDDGTLHQVETIGTLPAGDTVGAKDSGAEVCVHPSGRFLYGSNRGHDSLVVFSIDQAMGRLTLVEHVPSGGSTPRHFAIDPAGRFLLAANQDSGNVQVFSIDQETGRLSPTADAVRLERPVCVAFVPVGRP